MLLQPRLEHDDTSIGFMAYWNEQYFYFPMENDIQFICAKKFLDIEFDNVTGPKDPEDYARKMLAAAHYLYAIPWRSRA